jgi:hypothetical protein
MDCLKQKEMVVKQTTNINQLSTMQINDKIGTNIIGREKEIKVIQTTKVLEFNFSSYYSSGVEMNIQTFNPDIEKQKIEKCVQEDRDLINEYFIVSENIPVVFNLPTSNKSDYIYLIKYSLLNGEEDVNIETIVDAYCSNKRLTTTDDYKLKIQYMFQKRKQHKFNSSIKEHALIIPKYVEHMDDIYEILQFFEKQKNNVLINLPESQQINTLNKYDKGTTHLQPQLQIYFIIDINSKGVHGIPIVLDVNKYNFF